MSFKWLAGVLVAAETIAAFSIFQFIAQSIAPITSRAAQAAGIAYTAVQTGNAITDMLLFNPDQEWEVDSNTLVSSSTSTPFAFEKSGFVMKGKSV